MYTFWQDVLFGLRLLRKSPGFALSAILTLALGMSINASPDLTLAFLSVTAFLNRNDSTAERQNRLMHVGAKVGMA